MKQQQLFLNPKKDCISILEVDNRRLTKITEVIIHPLFNKIEVRKLEYPTRNQIHSKRYYITSRDEHIATLTSTLDEAIETSKRLLKEKCPYESYVNA